MKHHFYTKSLFLILTFCFGFSYSQKIDTLFVGKAGQKNIKKYINKKAAVFIVIRHGEKESNSKNPHLSEAGKKRAEKLAYLLSEVKIDKAYSSDFFRTRETLEPLLLYKNLKLSIYNPSDISGFVKNDLIFDNFKNIISGHSNTNSELINQICGIYVFRDIPDDKFNDIYIVNVFKKGNKIKIFHLLY